MPKLVECHEFTALKIATAFGDRLVIANLWLFLQLQNECSGGTVLQRSGQSAQTFDSFVKQFGHSSSVTRR
jgi:hypothetical protein